MKKIAFIFVTTLLLVSCKHVEPVKTVPVDSTTVVVDTSFVNDTIKPSKPVLEGTK